jgi:hypothetical protein
MPSSCAPTSERATVSNTVQFSINLSKKPGWQLSFNAQNLNQGPVWLIATTTPRLYDAFNNGTFDNGQVAFLSTQRLAGARTRRTTNPSPALPQSTVFFRRPTIRSSKYADSRQGDVWHMAPRRLSLFGATNVRSPCPAHAATANLHFRSEFNVTLPQQPAIFLREQSNVSRLYLFVLLEVHDVPLIENILLAAITPNTLSCTAVLC